MDTYIDRYNTFHHIIVYNFEIKYGGIGDNIKFFMYVLDQCIKNQKRLYYKKNNIHLEQFLKLKHDCMYIDQPSIDLLCDAEIVTPNMFYNCAYYDYSVPLNEVFYFTDEVKLNSSLLFPLGKRNYVSIHLRLGDKHLETDKQFVDSKSDVRVFSEESICKFIQDNSHENIFFCCDNNTYKSRLKEKYGNLITTDCDIGHTSFTNTTIKQVLDAVTEFYILSDSKLIFGASQSGFSHMAAKFNNIPLIQ